MKRMSITALLALASFAALAQMSPSGLWKTIDDDSKQEKSLVRIKEIGGMFIGTIEKVLDLTVKPDAICDKCSDERKDKPLIGLTILRNNGKVYRTRLKPVDGGRKLEMRGYIGPFYRTQVWIRVE